MSLPEPNFPVPTGLVDALNDVVLAVAGVSALYPPRNSLNTATDQVMAFVRGKGAPPVRTVAVEEFDGGLKIIARVGIDAKYGTPNVVSSVASAIRDFVSTQVNNDVRCVASVQAVSIQ